MLNKKQLEHLAQLSRLELSENDKSRFLKQLKDIFKFVSMLQKVDTKNIESTRQAIKNKTIWRQDVVEDFSDRDALLGSAPLHEKSYIKTKPILKSNKK